MDRETIRWFTPSENDLSRLREAAGRVLARHGWVKAAYLYGSVARGRGAVRDIDIGLLGNTPEWGAEWGIATELQAASGIHAVEFDVRPLGGADPVFLGALLREGQVLYESDREARIRFETQATSLWLDYRPVWDRVRNAVTRRWSGE